jgi:hypothetical protein
MSEKIKVLTMSEINKIPIKILYSHGYSGLHISFNDQYLSFRFMPYTPGGRTLFATEFAMITTTEARVDYGVAAVLYEKAVDIINNKAAVQEMVLTIPCPNGVFLVFERKPDQNERFETFLYFKRNNVVIPFKFSATNNGGMMNDRLVKGRYETDLIKFAEIIERYLKANPVSAYFDKMGDDFTDEL